MNRPTQKSLTPSAAFNASGPSAGLLQKHGMIPGMRRPAPPFPR